VPVIIFFSRFQSILFQRPAGRPRACTPEERKFTVFPPPAAGSFVPHPFPFHPLITPLFPWLGPTPTSHPIVKFLLALHRPFNVSHLRLPSFLLRRSFHTHFLLSFLNFRFLFPLATSYRSNGTGVPRLRLSTPFSRKNSSSVLIRDWPDPPFFLLIFPFFFFKGCFPLVCLSSVGRLEARFGSFPDPFPPHVEKVPLSFGSSPLTGLPLERCPVPRSLFVWG